MKCEDIQILSQRKWNNYFPLQVVYEWENIIAQTLSIQIDIDSTEVMNNYFLNKYGAFAQKIIRNSFLCEYIDNGFNYLRTGARRKKKYLCFVLYPASIRNHFFYSSSVIPIILDCFADVIDKVPSLFKNNPVVFVTNMEVYDRLKKTTLSEKVYYLPLSISDKYYNREVPRKKIDVLQLGRKNSILHDWMMQFVIEYPSVEYVYSAELKNSHGYMSTTNGWIGSIATRQHFMDFLGSAKVSLLSSPGIDGGEKRTGGFNPVTPRFYEAAIKYCYMVGRFPDTSDFTHNNIGKLCRRPGNYYEFKKMILEMLANPFNDINGYASFIEEHLTSRMSEDLRLALNDL